jgi:hypothetical protein
MVVALVTGAPRVFAQHWKPVTTLPGPIETMPGVTDVEINGDLKFKIFSNWYRSIVGNSSKGLAITGNSHWGDGAGILLHSDAATWDKGSINFVTTTTPDPDEAGFTFWQSDVGGNWQNKFMTINKRGRVGVNTDGLDARMKISHTSSNDIDNVPAVKIEGTYYTNTTDVSPANANPPNMLEVWGKNVYDTYPISSGSPVVSDHSIAFVVANRFPNFMVGVNKAVPEQSLDVNGTAHANYGLFGDNATQYPLGDDRLTVETAIGLYNPDPNLYNSLRGHSWNAGLALYANSYWGDGSGILLNGPGTNGDKSAIQFVTREGANLSEEGFSFRRADVNGNWPANLLNITKAGKVTASDLATGSNKMVVVDGSGTLTTEAKPWLSISGSNLTLQPYGSTVPLPSGADNLGNHTATQNLNMSNKDITGAHTVNVSKVDFGSNNFTISSGQIVTFSGFGVAGIPPIGDHFFVNGNSKLGGNVLVSSALTVKGVSTFDGNVTINGSGTYNSTWGSSDKSYKKDIVELDNFMDKLLRVRSYSYHFRKDEFPAKNFDDRKHIGFLAQELEQLFPDQVKKGEDGHYAVNYMEFIPMLLEAIKYEDGIIKQQQQTISELEGKVAKVTVDPAKEDAQSAKLTELESKLALLDAAIKAMEQKDAKIVALEGKVAELESNLNVCCQAQSNKPSDIGKGEGNILKSTLEQNVPNPFSGETVIGYNIAGKYSNAYISVSDMAGRVIKSVTIEAGSRQISVARGLLTPGAYNYSLFVDGQHIDTKRMIVSE